MPKPHATYAVKYDNEPVRYLKLVPENVEKANRGDWKMQRYVAIAYFFVLRRTRQLPKGWTWNKHTVELDTNDSALSA